MNGKVKVLLAALAVIILSALVLGCAAPAEKTAKAGDLVYVDYTLRSTNGSIIETSNATVAKENNIYNPANPYNPFSFIVGSGSTIQGFDDAVTGMKAGERKNVTITPDKAYGEYNASNILTVPLDTITDNNTSFSQHVGEVMQSSEGYVYVALAGDNNSTAKVVRLEKVPPRIMSISVNQNNSTATLDYNPPLAGKTLVFDITLVAINPSPSPT